MVPTEIPRMTLSAIPRLRSAWVHQLAGLSWVPSLIRQAPRNAAWMSFRLYYEFPRQFLYDQEPPLSCEPITTCRAWPLGPETISSEHTKIAFVRSLDDIVHRILTLGLMKPQCLETWSSARTCIRLLPDSLHGEGEVDRV